MLGASRREPILDAATVERAFVHRRRQQGVSWQHIAQQLGRCGLDVRRCYDPDYRGVL
jgi:hypothetical protein